MPISFLAIAIVIALYTVGCTTPNPSADPANPDQPAYVVDPRLGSVSNQVHQVANTVDQVTASGGLLGLLTSGVFAAAAALSGLYARHRSRVASTMADAVANTSPEVRQQIFADTLPRTKGQAVREEVVSAQRRRLDAIGSPPNSPVDSPTTRR